MKHLNIAMVPYISVLTLAAFFLTGLTGVSAAILPQHPHRAKPCGAWSQVTNPNVKGSLSDSLSGIVAITANNIWAVGGYDNASNNSQTLIEHWNGSGWSIVSSHNISSVANSLAAVSDLAAAARVPATKSVWAVGYTQDTNSQTFTMFHC